MDTGVPTHGSLWNAVECLHLDWASIASLALKDHTKCLVHKLTFEDVTFAFRGRHACFSAGVAPSYRSDLQGGKRLQSHPWANASPWLGR